MFWNVDSMIILAFIVGYYYIIDNIILIVKL